MTERPVSKMLLCALSAGAALSMTGAAAADVTYQTIAYTGRTDALGPNQGALTFVSTTGQPSINNAGQVLFRATNSVTGNPEGLWLFSGGINTKIALAGEAQPGGGSYATSFNSPVINNAGRVAW